MSANYLYLNLISVSDSFYVVVVRGDAIAIAKALGFLPLALDQAGAYISEAQLQLSDYLPRFENEFKRIAGKRPPGVAWQYGERTVLTTWEMSFKQLTPAAQELLLLCAFLDNEDIWEGLFPPERLKAEFGIGELVPSIP